MSQSKIETPDQENKKTKLTTAESIITGSVSGATEVLVDHPLWAIKTQIQRGDKLRFAPSVLYRGILANAASMIPITGLQVGLNSWLQNLFFKNSKELSNTQKISTSLWAGIGSAFISCPIEMVMTYQGKSVDKMKFNRAYSDIVKKFGYKGLYIGFLATAMREGMFTSSFLAGTPIIKGYIYPYVPNNYVASLLAGMSSGLGATLASQGVDTIKTVQQASDELNPTSFRSAFNKIYSTQGFYGFFKGTIPRGTRVMSAVTIMGYINEQMESYFSKK